MTEQQLRASEEAARAAPADKDGIWVNVSSTGSVMGAVYSSKEWADHYGSPHDCTSARYVHEARVSEERQRVSEEVKVLRRIEAGLREIDPELLRRVDPDGDFASELKVLDKLRSAGREPKKIPTR